jgi:hypothetical protein
VAFTLYLRLCHGVKARGEQKRKEKMQPMAFWSKWFGGTSAGEEAKAVKSLEYKGYMIEAVPFKDGGQWQLAGRITKEGREHKFVRADKFTSAEDAADIALSKGQLIIDQGGDRIFG